MLISLLADEVSMVLLFVGFLVGGTCAYMLLLVRMRRMRGKLIELEKVLFQDFSKMKGTPISTTGQ